MSDISGWTLLPTLTAICLFWLPSCLSLFCQTSEEMNSSMTSLQAEKEHLMRSVSEKEAELSSLRQAAQVQQSSLQQERERSSRELGELQAKLQEKVSQDSRALLIQYKQQTHLLSVHLHEFCSAVF